MDKSLARIPLMHDLALLEMYRNCVRAVVANTRFAVAAQEKLGYIIAEYRRRRALADAGHVFVETPDVGMLSTIGYRVGNGGEREPLRRRLLDYVMTAELPLVDSVAYTRQWGDPKSRARLWKLLRTLEGLAAGAEGRPRLALACTHWLEDRDYVERTWRDCVN